RGRPTNAREHEYSPMSQPTADLNVRLTQPLIPPEELEARVPIGERARATVIDGRRAVQAVLRGEDSRLLVITGPCSIHDERAAVEYAERLAGVAERVRDRLLIVMRV